MARRLLRRAFSLLMNKPKIFQWLAELCRLLAAILAGWGGANL